MKAILVAAILESLFMGTGVLGQVVMTDIYPQRIVPVFVLGGEELPSKRHGQNSCGSGIRKDTSRNQVTCSSFNFDFNGTFSSMDSNTIEEAGRIISQYIASTETIEVDVSKDPLAFDEFVKVLAAAEPDFTHPSLCDSVGGVFHDTCAAYPIALFNSLIHGDHLPNTEFDIRIKFNQDLFTGITIGGDIYKFHRDYQSDVPPGDYDLLSLTIHELLHGLGIESSVFDDDGLTQAVYSDSIPFKYDQLLTNRAGTSMVDLPRQLLADFVEDSVFISSQNATAPPSTGNKDNPAVYSPENFVFGQSLVHLDRNCFPDSNSPDLVCATKLDRGCRFDSIGPVVLGVLRDLGWTLCNQPSPTLIDSINSSEPKIEIFPNPFSNFLTIRFEGEKIATLEIYTLLGNKVFTKNCYPHMANHFDLSSLQGGTYLTLITSEGNFARKYIVKTTP